MALKKRRRFIALLLFLAGLFFAVVYFLGQSEPETISLDERREQKKDTKSPPEPVRLPKQESVENALKIEVEPIYVSEELVQFRLVLASYQNSESVGMDPLETTMLLDEENTPYEPVGWEAGKTDEYNKEGILSFQVSHFPQVLRLSIFELEERIFEWSLTEEKDK